MPASLPGGTEKRRLGVGDMLWCQGAQNIGLSNRKLKICAKVHRMIKMHDRPRQTDGQRDGTNIMAIARRFVLTNASCAKNELHVPESTTNNTTDRQIF